KINIMTMHKAKGLTSKMVILAALEDELIPGSQTGSKLDDERRLLYVSLTRAKHVLITTYCDKRLSQQKFSGKSPGKQRRNLTRFLEDSPIEVQNGDLVIENLINDHEKT
ncbi:MAG: ATP-dependent helicase, partial [Candidatus Marinimicrobia bacterium]|nr:ATP-dependent helicase [Candidatus Neomarinimicrobiota bacterium]